MFEFRQYMDLYERETISFIFGRTCMYGKEWENIPIRHFMHGVLNAEGDVVIGPVAISKTNLLRSLRLLHLKGLIDVRKSITGATRYRIKKLAELDVDHIVAVMHREQPRVFSAIQNRIQARATTRRPARAQALDDAREAVVDVIERNTRNTLGPNLDNGWSNFGLGAGPNLGQHNIPKVNIPISNIAAAPRITRRLIKSRKL